MPLAEEVRLLSIAAIYRWVRNLPYDNSPAVFFLALLCESTPMSGPRRNWDAKFLSFTKFNYLRPVLL